MPPLAKSRLQAWWERLSLALQLVLSLAVAGGALVYLMWSGSKAPSPEYGKRPPPPEEVVQIVGPRYREDLTLAAAEAIEARAPRLTPIDPK